MNKENYIINGREADIFLYGEIANNAGADDVVLSVDVVTELMRLSQSCDRIDVHINSEGGEVYAGISIFNALRACSKEVVVYTDGISASIAGIIAMCGRPHYMSKYARLMIHSVSAGVYGNKKDLEGTIDEILALENTLADIISSRMGLSAEEVKAAYFDGTDHWFTAEQAVAAGLADGIYDLNLEFRGSESASDVYKKVFTNRAAIRSQIIKDMFDVKKISQKTRFENVKSEDDVLKVIDDLLWEKESLERENEDLKARIKELEDKDIEKILETAVKAGKIDEGEKEDYRALLNSNRKSAEKILTALKPKRSIKNELGEDSDDPKEGAWDQKMNQIRENIK